MQLNKIVVLSLLFIAGMVTTAYALVFEEQARLTAGDVAAGNGFGRSAATDGEIIVVGATLDDDRGIDAGAVYIFHKSGSSWIEPMKLAAVDGADGDRFGNKIAIGGDTLVIAAIGDDSLGNNSGAVYVFRRRRNEWVEQAKLTAGDGESNDQFGSAVAIDKWGDTIVVGAPLEDGMGDHAGAAYVFQRSGSGWIEQTKLTAGDGGDGDFFGESVAVDGSTIVVGAKGDADAAYVFQQAGSSWFEQAKLSPSDTENACTFGDSVAIQRRIIVVGDSCANDAASGIFTGAVHIFQRSGSTWFEQARLLADDRFGADYFGWSVAINERADTIVVGAPLHTLDEDNLYQGAAYIIKRRGANWLAFAKLVASDANPDDGFGTVVAISENDIVVGTYSANSAYVYDMR